LPRRSSYPLLLLLALTVPAWRAHSRVWSVDPAGDGDAPTIQAAVDSAGPGDEIVVEPGIYSWSTQGHSGDYGMVFFASYVGGFTLRSSNGPEETFLDAEFRGRIMFIQSYNDIVIEGFTFRNGRAPASYDSGGGLIGHLSSPVIRNCVFTGNSAFYGGGLWYGGVSAPVLEDCVFIDNHAASGGAVCLVNSSSAAAFSGCRLEGNSAESRGGGIYAYHYRFEMTGCTLRGNSAGESGGGLCVSRIYPSTVERCTFVDNEAPSGGGIHVRYESDLTVGTSIIAFGHEGGALGVEPGGRLEAGCCLLFSNTGGDSIPPGAVDAGNILKVDPQFCGSRPSGNLYLQSDSPCLPFNHPVPLPCGRIGAYPAGCGTVGTERTPWGRIKRKER